MYVGEEAAAFVVKAVFSDGGVVREVRGFGLWCKFGFLYGDDVRFVCMDEGDEFR